MQACASRSETESGGIEDAVAARRGVPSLTTDQRTGAGMNRGGLAITTAAIILLGGCSGDAAEHATPCEEVVARIDEAQHTRAETFGRGPEARDAERVITETVTARPDCFPDGEPRPLRAEELLSEADAEGMHRAREECETGAGVWNPYGPSYGTYESIDAALVDTDVLLPDGTPHAPEPAADGSLIEFLDGGRFGGVVVLAEHPEGWVIQSVAICGTS